MQDCICNRIDQLNVFLSLPLWYCTVSLFMGRTVLQVKCYGPSQNYIVFLGLVHVEMTLVVVLGEN